MLAMVARGGGAGGVSCFFLPGWATGPCVGDGITSMRRGRINIWQKADTGDRRCRGSVAYQPRDGWNRVYLADGC